MEQWEYKVLEFKTTGFFTGNTKIGFLEDYQEDTTWTGKKVKKLVEKEISRDEMVNLFNELGKEGWELTGILPLSSRTGFGESITNRVSFIFRRKKL